jgi:hypothetical protein
VTVSVSARPAIFIVNGIVACWPTRNSTLSSTTDPNPESSACTLYVPGGTLSSRYSPLSSLTAVSEIPLAISVIVTVTPGSTALLWSATTPITEACCAYAAGAASRIAPMSIALSFLTKPLLRVVVKFEK